MGFEPGQLIVIGARPAKGKTSLLLNFAQTIAAGFSYTDYQQPGVPVAIFTLEMLSSQLVDRMVCGEAGINLNRLRDGLVNKEEARAKLQAAGQRLYEPKVYLDETAGISIQELRVRLILAVQKYGVKAAFVDYLQLAKSSSEAAKKNRFAEVGEVSDGLKRLAKDLRIPIFTAAQLNRKSEDRGLASKPKLSDLRESGNLEQDADIVIIIDWEADPEHDLTHDPHANPTQSEHFARCGVCGWTGRGSLLRAGACPADLPGPADSDGQPTCGSYQVERVEFPHTPAILNIAKQRNGPTGPQRVEFIRPLARFVNPYLKTKLYDR